jgi:hypothetical protein
MWSLVTFVNRYLDSHPGMTEATACRALVEASWVFDDSNDRDDDLTPPPPAPPKKARARRKGS